MTTREIALLRLANQGVSPVAGTGSTVGIVRHMGAMQAQDYYGSLWAVGVRTQATEKAVVKALEAYQVVRTWPQRGTLHLVVAEDVRWQVGLSAERLVRGARGRQGQLGLDAETLARSKAVWTKALKSVKGKGPLTRPQAMQLLEDAGISTVGGRGYHILWYLSQTGVTFIGPMAGKRQTIGLVDSLPEQRTPTRQECLTELTRRYFTSHGPATAADFAWWSGLLMREIREGLEANSTLLTSQKIGSKEYWSPKVMPKLPDRPAGYLLPAFDEYMLGYKDRSAALHVDHAQKVVPGGNGMFLPTIVVDGQVVGTWKRAIKKDHVLLTLSFFVRPAKQWLELLQEPAAAYGRFVGLPAQVVTE